jgi:hypothetical protein
LQNNNKKPQQAPLIQSCNFNRTFSFSIVLVLIIL